ncbi:MAG TPA: lipoprotein insertase outer membrane protein LolB [Gammaproteobacteria bacterium]|nr:lipoprotein insertase outer membrane protein LolB [Gammaproteobacteria bacterium]
MPESATSGPNTWDARRARLESIRHWRLRARIGVVAATQSGSADLQWEEQGEVFTLKVSGAFGHGLIAIEGDAASVHLKTGKGEQLGAASAEDLILQQTGWVIPVNGMRRWMLGLPSGLYPDESFTLDDAGRIDKLRGGGWEIEYGRYGLYHGHQLPDRIRMQNEQVKIKLAVIDWEILDANEQ